MHYFKYCLSVHLGFLFVLVSALTSQELCVCVCVHYVCVACAFLESYFLVCFRFTLLAIFSSVI